MAKKPEGYLVIDGCIQEGKTVYVKGKEYTPPTAELAAQLEKAGTIAPIRSPVAQALMRAATKAAPATGTADLLDEKDE